MGMYCECGDGVKSVSCECPARSCRVKGLEKLSCDGCPREGEMGDSVAEDDEPGGTPVGEALLHSQ